MTWKKREIYLWQKTDINSNQTTRQDTIQILFCDAFKMKKKNVLYILHFATVSAKEKKRAKTQNLWHHSSSYLHCESVDSFLSFMYILSIYTYIFYMRTKKYDENRKRRCECENREDKSDSEWVTSEATKKIEKLSSFNLWDWIRGRKIKNLLVVEEQRKNIDFWLKPKLS